eukprot:2859626-Ditylum_brightwellii.AAC.1
MEVEPTQGSYDPSTNLICAHKCPAVAIKVDDTPLSKAVVMPESTSTSTSSQNGTSASFLTPIQAYNSPAKMAEDTVTASALSTLLEQLCAELRDSNQKAVGNYESKMSAEVASLHNTNITTMCNDIVELMETKITQSIAAVSTAIETKITQCISTAMA